MGREGEQAREAKKEIGISVGAEEVNKGAERCAVQHFGLKKKKRRSEMRVCAEKPIDFSCVSV